jgi:hypothetical protein
MARTAVRTALTRDGERVALVPGPASTTPAPAPLATGPGAVGLAWANHVMNGPRCSTPASHERPEHLHQRKKRAMAWA